MEIAKHDGTESYQIVLPDVAAVVLYIPVPGGVVLLTESADDDPTSVFIPMARLEFERDANGQPTNVHLTSTLSQLMQGAAMAGVLGAMQMVEGG